jgi:AcrR family transcriptional regulator
MSVRAAQKAARRARMLTAAARLFELEGYARTTFNEIAAACGLGVATVYKYFKSKEGIVVALLQPDLDQMLARGEKVIAQPPADPAAAVVALLACYGDLGGGNWARREILRLTIFPGLGNQGAITDLIRAAESGVQRQIRSLLLALRASGRLAPTLRIDDATAVIFALLNQHFGLYLTDPRLGFRRVFHSLERTVRVAFDDWRARGRARVRRAR